MRHSSDMPQLVPKPVAIPVPGGKRIDEYVGSVATGDPSLSVAHMKAPPGWEEPAQTPEFREATVVLAGELIVETPAETLRVTAGQAVVTMPGETVRYLTGDLGAEYIAVCLPAFSEPAAHRGDQ